MPYKLAKYWFKSFNLLVSIFFLSFPAFATLKVVPVSPYTLNNGTVFYAAKTNTMDTAVGFTDFDLKQKQDPDATVANRPNILLFDVTSDTLTAANLILNIKTAVTTSLSVLPLVPISVAAGNNCGLANCRGQITGSTNFSNFGYFFAANYIAKSTLRVGIYPLDICFGTKNQNQGPVALGCTEAIVSPPVAGTPTRFSVTFNVGEPTAVDSPDIKGTAESTTLTLSFQAAASPFVCPSLTDVYFPGDSQIVLNAGLFATTPTAGNAPVDTLVVAGKEGAAPTATTVDFSTGNDIVTRLSIGSGQQNVSGFNNSDSTGDAHKYTLAFTVRDSAGVLSSFLSVPPVPPGTLCSITDVRTTEVQGFLNKSNCFIATAAFRTAESFPIYLLQNFRDAFLLQTDWGIFFVKKYYQYSPKAATWLVEHPDFRYPVLLLLAPLELLAWMILNPVVLLTLLLLEIGLLLTLFKKRNPSPTCYETKK